MSETETEVIECPAEGCEYTGPEKNVKSHWGGKGAAGQSEAHQGSFYEALDGPREDRTGVDSTQGDANGHSSPSEAVDTQPAQDPEPVESTQQTASSGGGLSLSGPPEPDPEPEPEVEDEEEDLVCPKCGAPTGQDREWFERVDVWQCDECGTKWRGVP